MNGIILKSMKAALLSAGLVTMVGCYRDVVDTCYPARYSFVAHNTVCSALKAQVNNGHVLEQTLWSWHFEEGKANLNAAGMEQLDSLIRRRPQPDPVIYLATAHQPEVRYDPAAPEKFTALRADLNERRKDAIVKYVEAMTKDPKDGSFLTVRVDCHDPTELNLPADQAGRTISAWNGAAKGVLSSGGGGGGGGGAAPGGR